MTHRTALIASVVLTVLLAVGIVAAADQLFTRQTAASVQVLDPGLARPTESKPAMTSGARMQTGRSGVSDSPVSTAPIVIADPRRAEFSQFAADSDDRSDAEHGADRDQHERAGKRASRERHETDEHEEDDDD